jgi:hypothetical protein
MTIMKTTRTLLSTIIAVLACVAATQTSSAQVVPFKSTGTNNAYMPTSANGGLFGGIGQTSHMGRTSGNGEVLSLSEPNEDLEIEWTGAGDFVAANGDTICYEGGGVVTLIPIGVDADTGEVIFIANWQAEFSITGGTGRFENVGNGSAPLAVLAINDPFKLSDPVWTYSYEIVGDIDLGHN